MIRQPARPQRAARGRQASHKGNLPPPTGGWNVRDPLASMPARDASVLENLFPKASNVILRKGTQTFADGFDATVQALLPYNGPAGTRMFAATGVGIYEVTTGAKSALLISRGAGRHRYVNFGTSGGHFLLACNGVDQLTYFNGTTWALLGTATVPALTGFASTEIVNIAVACSRLWFIRRDSSSAYYLGVGAIAGAMTEFPLAQVFPKGGHLRAIGTWTVDGGSGSDDYTIFFSSEGEIAVYRGTDPASSSTFSKVGTYYVGEPIGYDCMTKFGGDVLILCREGLFPLSKALQSVSVDRTSALTSKIDQAFADAVSQYGNLNGWSTTVFPEGGFVLVNVPTTANYYVQYVMNSITGAWCQFTGILSHCWLVWRNHLYFGSNTLVGLAWEGENDFGANIVGKCRQAYNYFGSKTSNKLIQMLSPVIELSNTAELKLGFDVDFLGAQLDQVLTTNDILGSTWDLSLWDVAVWGAGGAIQNDWCSVSVPVFYIAAFRLQISTNKSTFAWSSTNFLGELAGVL